MDGKRIVPGRLALGFTAQVEEFLSSVVSTALGDEEVEKQRRLEQCKNELLWWSAEFKRFDMWEYLLEKGADMKAKFAGKVYLHKAAYWGVIPSVERHLQRGCPVDIRDDFKLTPLFWSVAKGRTQCTDLLISNGADVLHASPWQFTNEVIQNCIFALKDSLPEKHESLKDYFWKIFVEQNEEIERMSVEEENFWRNYLLATAAGSPGDIDACRKLLDKGADPTVSTWMPSPFDLASTAGNTCILKLFIDMGLPLDKENAMGWTALWNAAAKGHQDCLELLLRSGANPMHITVDGTAIEVAKLEGKIHIVRILQTFMKTLSDQTEQVDLKLNEGVERLTEEIQQLRKAIMTLTDVILEERKARKEQKETEEDFWSC